MVFTRECGVDLHDYAQEHPFDPIGHGPGEWYLDPEDYYHAVFGYTSRDLGHGGQLILLRRGQEMVIVVTQDPLFQQHDDDSWKYEKQAFGPVGPFLEDLPAE